ncbi:hypothetical protein J6590_039978 [Homalodisca vitripennis]|nr:hypothetical protein J6590_004645 [Homalodisca vitripennis]KAG8326516.1 hypothetical protein J6590_039978 [Homalodisca vitripennis]
MRHPASDSPGSRKDPWEHARRDKVAAPRNEVADTSGTEKRLGNWKRSGRVREHLWPRSEWKARGAVRCRGEARHHV